MAETLEEVYFVIFYKGKKRSGWWDDVDECITKNKNHITYFGNEKAAEDALKRCGITKEEYTFKIDYCMMSLKEFMTKY